MTDMAAERVSYGERSESMDASVWSELQHHIDLTMVYTKLPIEDFFRLRLVCKEWNRVASDRGFLENLFREPIPKPFFIVGNWKMHHRLLTYDNISRRWSSTRVPYAFCEVEGVFRVENYGTRVFNAHTRVFYDPPRAPKPPVLLPPLSDSDDDVEEFARRDEDAWDDPALASTHIPLLGMTADTSVWPYAFQMILGDSVFETRVYNSTTNSWTISYNCMDEEYDESHLKISSARCKSHLNNSDLLFLNVWRTDGTTIDLHVYDLELDEWDSGPAFPDEAWLFGDIGAWQDNVFFVGVKKSHQSSCGITVLELCGGSGGAWRVFDAMPEELCAWMLAGQGERLDDGPMGTMEMQSTFCGEFVLVWNCVGFEEVTERAVLYSLDRKMWERVELPGPRSLLWSEAGNGLTIGLRNAILGNHPVHIRTKHEQRSKEAP